MLLSIDTTVLSMRFGDERAFELIKEAGFDAVDFQYVLYDYNPTLLGDDYLSYAKKLRNKLDSLGLVCHQSHAPNNYIHYGDALDCSNIRYVHLLRSIESASILGAKYIVVHRILTPEGVNHDDFNYKFYKDLEPYAKKFGIKIAVENCYGEPKENCTDEIILKGSYNNPKHMNDFLDRLNSDVFCACLDFGHASMMGMPPQDFIRGIKKEYLKVIHVHDNDLKEDLHTLPYFGFNDWTAICNALKEVGYKEDFSMELIFIFARSDVGFTKELLDFSQKTGRFLMGKIL